jgi:aspartate/methionine/tyrosine aminotransferase
VALALPQLLADGAPIREAIGDRCSSNLESLRSLVSEHPAVSLGPVGGGWNAVLRVPSVVSEEELCLQLLERRGVAVHPGHFFGFPGKGWLVISLLPSADPFAEGVRLLLDGVAQTLTLPRSGSGGG